MPFEQIVFRSLTDVPETVKSEGTMLWNKTGSWRYLRPFYGNRVPPCNNGCPAGNDVEFFIRLMQEKEYEKAWEMAREEILSSLIGDEYWIQRAQLEAMANPYSYRQRPTGEWNIGQRGRYREDRSPPRTIRGGSSGSNHVSGRTYEKGGHFY